jgi:hypothetical protein
MHPYAVVFRATEKPPPPRLFKVLRFNVMDRPPRKPYQTKGLYGVTKTPCASGEMAANPRLPIILPVRPGSIMMLLGGLTTPTTVVDECLVIQVSFFWWNREARLSREASHKKETPSVQDHYVASHMQPSKDVSSAAVGLLTKISSGLHTEDV